MSKPFDKFENEKPDYEITWNAVWLVLCCVAVLLAMVVILADNIDKVKNVGLWIILGVVCIFGLRYGWKIMTGKL